MPRASAWGARTCGRWPRRTSRTLLPGLYHELPGVLALTVAVRESVDGSVTWMLQAPERTNAVAVALRIRRPIGARPWRS